MTYLQKPLQLTFNQPVYINKILSKNNNSFSWQERVVKYAELCTLEYYLTKYEVLAYLVFVLFVLNNLMIQEAFEGGAEKIKEFQHAMDDDIERGEKLKSELVRDGWGGKFNNWMYER